MNKLYLLFIATAMLGLTLTSCNTVRGVGQDVEQVGSNIEHAAH